MVVFYVRVLDFLKTLAGPALAGKPSSQNQIDHNIQSDNHCHNSW